MAVTSLSLAALVIAAVALTIGALQGRCLGWKRALVGFGTTVFVLLLSLMAAGWLGDAVARWGADWIVYFVRTMQLPLILDGREPVLLAAVEMLAAPFVMLLLFVLLRPLAGWLTGAVIRKLKKQKDASGAALVLDGGKSCKGMLIGAINGYLVCAILLSPFLGTMRLCGDVVDSCRGIRYMNMDSQSDKELERLVDYSNDFACGVLYVTGGGLVYDAAAVAELDGQVLYLSQEAQGIQTLIRSLDPMVKILYQDAELTEEEMEIVAAFGQNMGDAALPGYLMTAFFPQMAKSWLNNQPYMGWEVPDCAPEAQPIFTAVLQGLTQMSADSAVGDVHGGFYLYALLRQNGLVNGNAEWTTALKDSDWAREPMQLLENQPNMHKARLLLQQAVCAVEMGALQRKHTDTAFKSLMEQLTLSLHNVWGKQTVREEMREHTARCLQAENMTLPDFVCDAIADVLVEATREMERDSIQVDLVTELLTGYGQ